MKKITKNKDIRLSGTLADRWVTLQNRFGYKTNIHLIDDMMYFFETNPVNPKQSFGGIFKKLEDKMIEFNSDNNRVIAIVRNIEKLKIDPIYRALMTEITSNLLDIRKRILLSEENRKPTENNSEIQKEIEEKITKQLTEKYENKLSEHRKSYMELNKKHDQITLENARIHNKFSKLSKLYLIEKSTFGSKNKIVFDMNESEFLELISLK
jgi:hypothetical protein